MLLSAARLPATRNWSSEGKVGLTRFRKRIEEPFGWIKAIAGLGKVKVRGLAKAGAVFTFAIAAYNLVRIPRLLEQAAI